MNVLVIVLSLLATACLFNVATLAFALPAGLRLKEFSVGFGPVLFTHRRATAALTVRALPTGGSVSFHDEPGSEAVDGGIRLVMALPATWRIAILLAGPVAMLTFGMIPLLGVASKPAVIFGVVAVWGGAVGLLPLPCSNGFFLLASFFSGGQRRPAADLLPWWIVSPLVFLQIGGTLAALVYFCLYTDRVLSMVGVGG